MTIPQATNQDRWRQIEELFHATLDVPNSKKSSILDEACKNDPTLRAQVDRLIRGHLNSRGFIEPPEDNYLGKQVPSNMPILTGRRIGAFTLVRPIASGGMGIVYEAVQDEPERTVALKVCRSTGSHPNAQQKLREEAAILGRLRHAGIAQVFEAGTDEVDGESINYFAMEFVPEATSITHHARDNNLAIADRIRLVIRVCNAVHHGHQNGVIHRDLKPQNILVDKEGDPKVIDFGIARVLDNESDLAVRTLEGQLIGTLAYASPEQVTGRAMHVDARADVYALGVLLYEMVSGQLPHDVRNRSIPQVIDIIQNEDPREPTAIEPSVPKDLSTIVMKAMEKSPERRYDSVSELAADLQRFLRSEPIVARPARLAYQARLFARRHRGLVTAGTIAVASLLIAAAAGILIGVREAHHRRRAESVARQATMDQLRAERIKDYVVNLFNSANPTDPTSSTLTVREWLDRAAPELTSDLGDQPLIEAEMQFVIASAYKNLGEYDIAESGFRRALEIYEEVSPKSDKYASCERELAGCLMSSGQLDLAIPMLRESLAFFDGLQDSRRRELLKTLCMLGEALRIAGQFDEAECHILRAEKIANEDPEFDDVNVSGILSLIYYSQERQDEAKAAALIALEHGRRLYGDEHFNVAIRLNNVAGIDFHCGRYLEAANRFREASDLLAKIVGTRHPFYASMIANVGVVSNALGDSENAIKHFAEALEILREVLPPHHNIIAGTIIDYCSVLIDMGRVDEAREILAGINEEMLGSPVIRARTILGEARLVLVDSDREMLLNLEEALALLRQNLPPNHHTLAESLVIVAKLYRRVGRLNAALEHAEEALETWELAHVPESLEFVRTRCLISQIFLDQEKYESAARVLAVARAMLCDHHADNFTVETTFRAAAESLYAVWNENDTTRQQSLLKACP